MRKSAETPAPKPHEDAGKLPSTLADVHALDDHLQAEGIRRFGTALGGGVLAGALRWYGLLAHENTHRIAPGDANDAIGVRVAAFDQVSITPARDLAELLVKLAVLHAAWRDEPGAIDSCNMALLGSILADTAALALLAPAGGAP